MTCTEKMFFYTDKKLTCHHSEEGRSPNIFIFLYLSVQLCCSSGLGFYLLNQENLSLTVTASPEYS